MRFVYEMIRQGFDRILSGDAYLFETLWRTLMVAAIASTIALAIGLPIAYWLAERNTRWRRAGLIAANAGLGLPPVVLGVYLALLLRPGSPLAYLRWDNKIQGVILAQVLLALPIVVALTASALRSLPTGLLEQAAAFGASRVDVGLLAVREARVGVLAAMITAVGSALAEVGAVVIVGGNSPGFSNTLASSILLEISSGDPAGATACVLLLVGILVVLGGVLTSVQQRHVT